MIKPIIKTPMYEEIVYQITNLIKKGKWKPNEQLPSETELAKAFNVSRNSIREALKSLSLLGIIYAHPGQGTFIIKDALQKLENSELIDIISEKASTAELMETRLVIEPHLSELAALRATDQDKRKLEKVFDPLKNDLSSRIIVLNREQEIETASETTVLTKGVFTVDELQQLKTNPSNCGIEFHMCIAETARNKVLTKFLQSIKGKLEWQRSWIYFKNSQDIRKMLVDHTEIYEAIITNDRDRARRAMYKHLVHTYENISEYDVTMIKNMKITDGNR